MKNLKKSFVVLLIFLLVFSNFTVVAANPQKIDPVKLTKEVLNKDKSKISKQEWNEKYKATDQVRVIVEVEGEPAITYATKQGKQFSELTEGKKSELQSLALDTQEVVKNSLRSKKVKMEYKESFTTVYNGFSGFIAYKDVEVIENLPGVTSVTISTEYKRPEAEPNMTYSKELVEAQATWDEYGYNGEGMIVGVIDSGADPDHKDFVLSEGTEADLSKEEVNAFVSENSLPGQYYNEKVPYGYNYMDENKEIKDLGPAASMHGMHVSGTVLANGDEKNGGIKGVAPEAQLLALKVFGNDPEMGSTWGDIYIKAIDDAIILGADVVNMSLGSTAAFVDETDPEQQAISNAVENGILMSISAGNSAHLGKGFYNPYAANPDIGVVGSPGLSYDSLQVASLENSYMDMDALQFNAGEESGQAPFMSASNVHPNDVGGTYEVEYVGTGTADEFGDRDLTGKFALAVRGNAFTDTALNALAANAAGVIVYNHSDGWVSMASLPEITIPQLFMQKTDGDLLKSQLDAGVKVTITFAGEKVTTANPLADSMSSFSSWGVTPNLDFKPEITAPGGNILSTFQDDAYGTMSGTSMAAPHVAGGSALLLQRVDEEFGLEGRDRVQMAENILMNTSAPVFDKGTAQSILEQENPYSPRRQGAGIMQLHAAASTPVVVKEEKTNEAKVALKEVNDQISFTLEATNYSDENVTYDVAANVQTDLSLFGLLGYQADVLEAQELIGAVVTINDGETELDIPANDSRTIQVQIDVSEAKVFNENASAYVNPEEIFTNGYFVEGYVTLKNEALPELSVPYVGFNGDWNKPPVLDELAYDGNNSFYEAAGMLYDGGDDSYYYLGYNPFTGENTTADIAISPNGDGINDEAIPILSFLRNAKTVEYHVLDAEGNKLRTVGLEENIRKNYYDGGLGEYFYLDPVNGWDGTVKNKVVEDGKYIFEIATTIDYKGKEAQTLEIPVTVDTTQPQLLVNFDGQTAVLNANDDHSGVSYIEFFVDGKSKGIVSPDTTKYKFDEKIAEDRKVEVVAVDNAGNRTEVIVSDSNDTEIPVISVQSPETFGIYDTNEIVVSGTVKDDSEVVEFTVEGMEVELVWDTKEGHYTFETTVEYEDGDHPIHIYAKDEAGNETSLSNSRLFFVDTTKPGLKVEAPSYVKSDVESVEISANLSDNFDELRFSIDGSEVYYHEMTGYAMKPINEKVTADVPLEPGENVVEMKVVDLAGNITTKEIDIYRATSAEDGPVSRISGTSRYDTAIEVSKEGWELADTVVLAQGNNFADALAGVPLAKKYDAPLLLTQTDSVTEVTQAEIERLGAKSVYLLGGELAISAEVEAELVEQGLEVIRVSGGSRIETAAAIANEVAEDGAAQAVVVNGYNFPDALSVAAYAADLGLPILLTQSETILESTKAALTDLGAKETLVIGGSLAVSEQVAEQVPGAKRISGTTREGTAVAVAEYFDVDTTKYYVTTGSDFPDALSVAALAAKDHTGVLLVRSSVPSEVEEFISRSNINLIKIIGGKLAVSDEILAELEDLLK